MTIPEMVWVLNKVKECILQREDNTCCHDCRKCQSFVEYTSLLSALDSIINLVFKTGESNRRH